MMKLLPVISLVLFVTSNSFAAKCNLDKPIELKTDFLVYDLSIRNIVVDETPQFAANYTYNPRIDKLDVHLFNIRHNNIQTGAVGVNVRVANKLEGVGFANHYGGNFSFNKSIKETNGVITYKTKNGYFYQEPQHAKNEAINEAEVVVQGKYITAINLTYPVFKIINQTEFGTRIAFTGVNHTICVKTAY